MLGVELSASSPTRAAAHDCSRRIGDIHRFGMRRIAIGSLRSIASIRARYGAYGPRGARSRRSRSRPMRRGRADAQIAVPVMRSSSENAPAETKSSSRHPRPKPAPFRPDARGTVRAAIAACISGSALTCSPDDSSESDSQRSVLSRPRAWIARWIDVTGASAFEGSGVDQPQQLEGERGSRFRRCDGVEVGPLARDPQQLHQVAWLGCGGRQLDDVRFVDRPADTRHRAALVGHVEVDDAERTPVVMNGMRRTAFGGARRARPSFGGVDLR